MADCQGWQEEHQHCDAVEVSSQATENTTSRNRQSFVVLVGGSCRNASCLRLVLAVKNESRESM